MQFWIPVVSKWTTQKEYRTLADVPECIDCVVVNTRGNANERLVRCRKGSNSFMNSTHSQKLDPASWYLVDRVLDPIPDPPAPTLADLPDGRCFQTAEYPGIIRWKHAGALYRVLDGGVRYVFAKDFNTNTNIAVLDLEMQLQDVPVAVSK